MNLTRHLTINVEGWPQYAVEMLKKLVQAFKPHPEERPPCDSDGELPLWPGVSAPIEQLRREEIYKDV